LPPALSGAWSAVADGDADGSRARPIRQVHSATRCGYQRLHQHRKGAARRRRRSDHHGHSRVNAVPPTSHADGPHTPDRCRRTPRQVAEANYEIRAYDAAVAQARPPHRRRRIARRSLPPASSRTPRMHSCGTACRGCVLRRTPTHPRHDLRVALSAISSCHRTAEGRARTYRIAANSEAGVAQAALTGT
jgi:hypothetical protein